MISVLLPMLNLICFTLALGKFEWVMTLVHSLFQLKLNVHVSLPYNSALQMS